MPFNPHDNVNYSFVPISQMKKLMFIEIKLIYGKIEIWTKVWVKLWYIQIFSTVFVREILSGKYVLLISEGDNCGKFWRQLLLDDWFNFSLCKWPGREVKDVGFEFTTSIN